jgi:hypothetical protein
LLKGIDVILSITDRFDNKNVTLKIEMGIVVVVAWQFGIREFN